MLGKLNGDSLVQASETRKQIRALTLFLTCLDIALTTCLLQSAPIVTSKPGALWIKQGVDLERVEPLEGVWPTKPRAYNILRQNKQHCNED